MCDMMMCDGLCGLRCTLRVARGSARSCANLQIPSFLFSGSPHKVAGLLAGGTGGRQGVMIPAC